MGGTTSRGEFFKYGEVIRKQWINQTQPRGVSILADPIFGPTFIKSNDLLSKWGQLGDKKGCASAYRIILEMNDDIKAANRKGYKILRPNPSQFPRVCRFMIPAR